MNCQGILSLTRKPESTLLPKLTLELDQLLNALFFVALLLYLIPAVFGLGGSPEQRRRFQIAAIVTLGTAIAIAVVASVIWFTR
jgi:hypothetical protein